MKQARPAWVCSGDDSPLGLGFDSLNRAGHRPSPQRKPRPAACKQLAGAYFTAQARLTPDASSSPRLRAARRLSRAWVRQAERDFSAAGVLAPRPPTDPDRPRSSSRLTERLESEAADLHCL